MLLNHPTFVESFLVAIFIFELFQFTYNQYQQTFLLAGNKRSDILPIYGTTGEFSKETMIGGTTENIGFLINNDTELIVFHGRRCAEQSTELSDQAWVFSIPLKQWKFVKGRKSQESSIFSETNIFETNNQIGARRKERAWKTKDIITFFGGCSDDEYLNEMWKYNISSNMYAVIHYDSNSDDYYANYILEKEYNPANIPGGRFEHTLVKLNDEKILVFGGQGFLLQSSGITTTKFLSDWWIFSTEKLEWKIMGGNLHDPFTIMVQGETNVYHKNNTIGSRKNTEAVLINEEEVLSFFCSFMVKDSTSSFSSSNIIQKYNISSNQWKFISGGITQTIGFRYYTPENNVGRRSGFRLSKINDKEIMFFGGSGYFSDLWSYHIELNQWKFQGKEISRYDDRYSYYSEDYSYTEDTMIGSRYHFVMDYSEQNKELIIGFGYGFTRLEKGITNDLYRIYFGNICNLKEDKDPDVCLQRGICVGHNLCECQEGFYGNNCELFKCKGILSNESNVCSSEGICLDSKCLCYETTEFTLEDCSIDEAQKQFYELLDNIVENMWIYVSVPLVIIVISVVLIVVITLLIIFFLRLRKTQKKIKGIDDIDLILDEARMEQNSTNPKIKINKSLFEVEYKDLKLLSVIGEGGSNSVCYLVQWKGNYCAYKAFKNDSFAMTTTGNDSFYEEFEKEVKLYSSINHPSILQFYGACVNPPHVGILLQYCQNGDLSKYLRKYKFQKKKSYPLKHKLRLLKEIALGMQYLHSIDAIHRDLKPENVLVDENEHSKIMDFGLSKLVSNEEKTMTKQIGTSFYMAPEINFGKYSNKCDVFSFAILAYVVITENFLPYGNTTNQSLLINKISENPNFRPEIKQNEFKTCQYLIPFIERNWSDDPDSRNTFEEIVKFLQTEKHEEKIKENPKKKEKPSIPLKRNSKVIKKGKENLNRIKEKFRILKEENEDLKKRLLLLSKK